MKINSEIQATVRVVLKLTGEEAQWLHAQMQNPLHGQTPEEELDFDRNIRAAFFEATAFHMPRGVSNHETQSSNDGGDVLPTKHP